VREDLQELLRWCQVRRSRGSGPGGQHRNVTESKVDLLHLPSGLRVVCDETRSQHQNLELALARLQGRLEAAARVRAPRVVRQKRLRRVQESILADKRRRGEIKRQRRGSGGEGRDG
jgi:protein subunit release factor B